MTQILVLGNSHLVAVKLGWEEQVELEEEFTPTFIGAPGNWFNKLELSGTVLKQKSDRVREQMEKTGLGVDEIDLEEWDAFVLVGMFLQPLLVVRMYTTHRLPQHREAGKQIISEAAFEAAVAEAMHATSAYRTALKLREVSDAPICVLTNPFPSARIRRVRAPDNPWASPHLDFLYDAYHRHLQALFDGLDVDVVSQPSETIVNGMFTQPRYSRGAIRMVDGHPYDGTQHYHMNAAYGALMVDACAERLRSRLGAAAAS